MALGHITARHDCADACLVESQNLEAEWVHFKFWGILVSAIELKVFGGL